MNANTSSIKVFRSNARMSSKEIAEVMEKNHKNVMRDIKKLIEEGAIDRLRSEPTSYMDSYNRKQSMYMLDFQATMTLITGYDANRRALVIDRWMKLETGQVTPALMDKPFSLLPIDREFRAAVRMAKAAGLSGNQAVLSADRLTREMTGSAPLRLLQITHLKSETTSVHLTPSDIGKQIGMSGQKVNKVLEGLGLQESYRDHKDQLKWRPTKKGESLAIMKDTGKKHGGGTPVFQLFWLNEVLGLLKGDDN